MMLAPKDDHEVLLMKRAASISSEILTKYLKAKVIEIIDGEKKIRHSKLAEGIENALTERKFLCGADPANVDICYPAIIQSGGQYVFEFSCLSNKDYLSYDCIVCCLGIRYRNYCSNIIRTLMVDPSDQLQQTYDFLVELQEFLIDKLRPGIRLCDLYDAGIQKCKEEKPDLVPKLTKQFGFVIGLEFRETQITVSPKCLMTVRKGMTFALSIGLSDLKDKDKDVALYIGDTVLVQEVSLMTFALSIGLSDLKDKDKDVALYIGDTVLVQEDKAAVVFTSAKKRLRSNAVFLKTEGEEEEAEGEEEDKEEDQAPEILSRGERAGRAVLTSKLR
ncbi:unnamed protein product, partial [Cyprideis torosa]